MNCRPATFQRPTADRFGATSSVPLPTTLATTSPHDTWRRRQCGCSSMIPLHILGERTKHFEIKDTCLATYWHESNNHSISITLHPQFWKEAIRTWHKLCIDCRCHVLNMFEHAEHEQSSFFTCRGTGASYRYRPTTRERHPVSAMSGWPSRCHWRQLNASGGFQS